MKLDGRKRYFRIDIVRLNGQRAIQHGRVLKVGPENSVAERNLLERFNIARVEVSCALQVSCGRFPVSLAPLDITRQPEYPGVVGQGLAGNFQFSQSAIVIKMSMIKIAGMREMRFT